MDMSKHVIIYSHGFGVEKDDRGLFMDIAKSMPDIQHVMFDYNTVDHAKNKLIVSSLRAQSRKLRETYERVKISNPGAVVDIIAHSQGCIIVAIQNLDGIRKTLFLAPPDSIDKERLISTFTRPGAVINFKGNSTIPRRDGTTTIIPPDYWNSINLNLNKLYDFLAEKTDLTIVEAYEDEVLGITDFSNFNEKINLKELRADHNFTGESRNQVLDLIRQYLD
jgi:hypothetical protein